MSTPSDLRSGSYVLMTAAHNEEAFIEGTLRSVLSQTLLPARWVIVSDNSSDRTDEIVESFARQHDFIRFLRISRTPGHSYGAKVIALQKAAPLLGGAEYDFIGNLDADISLDASYFEELLNQFHRDPRLGIVSGWVCEDSGSGYRGRRINDVRNAPHAAQLVRRECYEAIGGYAVLKYGGEDWYAQTQARMRGWQVESLARMQIFHHRHTGTSSSPVKNAFRLGRLDHSFGSDPAFEVMKCLGRVREWPYFLAALARLAGFTWPYLCGEPREVPDEFAAFLRREQRQRIASLLRRASPVQPMPAPDPSTDGSARSHD